MVATLNVSTIQATGSTTPNLTLDTAGNATVGNTLVMGSSFKRNRIINGNMAVDQRNAGASVTANNAIFPVDRFAFACSKLAKEQANKMPVPLRHQLAFLIILVLHHHQHIQY